MATSVANRLSAVLSCRRNFVPYRHISRPAVIPAPWLMGVVFGFCGDLRGILSIYSSVCLNMHVYKKGSIYTV